VDEIAAVRSGGGGAGASLQAPDIAASNERPSTETRTSGWDARRRDMLGLLESKAETVGGSERSSRHTRASIVRPAEVDRDFPHAEGLATVRARGFVLCSARSSMLPRLRHEERKTLSAQKPDRSLLRLVRMFQDLGDADLDALLASLRFRELEVPEVVWSQGDVGDTMVVVCYGRVGVYTRDGEGPELELGQSGAGEILGEMACIDPAPRSATLAALETTLIGELSRDALRMLREHAPNVYATILSGVIGDVTRRLRDVDAKIDALGSDPKASPAEPAHATAEPASERGGFWGVLDRWRKER